MRIAFLLSGQPRTFEFCYSSVKNLIMDVYHPDIFICSDEQRDKLIELYHPVGIDVRPQEEILDVALRQRKHLEIPGDDVIKERDYSTIWKSLRCGQMMWKYEEENGFRYDVVMMGRFDVKYLYIQPIEPVPDDIICIPKVDARLESPNSDGLTYRGYSGQLMWCSAKTGDKIIGEMLFGKWDYIKYSNYKVNDEPEKLFKYMCDVNGIRPQYVDIKMMIIKGQPFAPLAFDLGSLDRFPEFL